MWRHRFLAWAAVYIPNTICQHCKYTKCAWCLVVPHIFLPLHLFYSTLHNDRLTAFWKNWEEAYKGAFFSHASCAACVHPRRWLLTEGELQEALSILIWSNSPFQPPRLRVDLAHNSTMPLLLVAAMNLSDICVDGLNVRDVETFQGPVWPISLTLP